ncbi:MAG: NAD(P)-dependent oxidoreductase [Planctomycetaceae bacterium]|nr:NAD(P)-dependent oxidoreductase [Planctomycetaceae bacterium]
MPDVGLIGIGLLGTAISECLVASGRSLIGFDLDADRRVQLTQAGGIVASDIAEVLREAPIVILSLPDHRIVERVVSEFPTAARGTLIIDTTTGDPESAIAIGRRLNEQGLRYVEATVIGSSRMLRERDVVVLLGGADADVAAAEPLVDAWARQRFHVGPLGSAATAKLVANLVLGLNRAVLAEGLNLAQRSGLDGSAMLEVLRSGLAYSRVMDTKGRKMLDGEFTPEARLKQHHKDVGLILELGARCRARVPLTALHDRLLARAAELGFADADNSAIIRAFQEPL